MRYYDRGHAGRALAGSLGAWRAREGLVVVGLEPSGVVVAAEVARSLRAPVDVLLLRRIPVPTRPDATLGATASPGTVMIDEDLAAAEGLGPAAVQALVEPRLALLAHDLAACRGARPPLDPTGRRILLVTQGLGNAEPVRYAIRALREQGAADVVVAAPVGDPAVIREIEAEAPVACCYTPEPFLSVGLQYHAFDPVLPADVRSLLSPRPPEPDVHASP